MPECRARSPGATRIAAGQYSTGGGAAPAALLLFQHPAGHVGHGGHVLDAAPSSNGIPARVDELAVANRELVHSGGGDGHGGRYEPRVNRRPSRPRRLAPVGLGVSRAA